MEGQRIERQIRRGPRRRWATVHVLTAIVSMALLAAGLTAFGSTAVAEEGPPTVETSAELITTTDESGAVDEVPELADEPDESVPPQVENGTDEGQKDDHDCDTDDGVEAVVHEGTEDGTEEGHNCDGKGGTGNETGDEPSVGDYVCTSDPCLVCLAIPEAPYYQPAYFERTQIINGEGAVKENGPAANAVSGVHPDDPWGNVVPPVIHKNGKGTFEGLNWSGEGPQVWRDNCKGDTPLPPPDDNGGHQRVDVCIATTDRANPYALESFGTQQIINGEGKAKHNSPALNPVEGVFPAEVWGNIIQPFTHTNGKATFDGLNWTETGQKMLEAKCVYVPPAEPPAPPPPGPAPAVEPVIAAAIASEEPAAVVTEPEVVAVVEPAVVPETVQLPELAKPAKVADAAEVTSAPQAATVPTAVNAGGGSSDAAHGLVWLLCLLILSFFSAAGSAARFVSSGASLR